MQLQYLPTAKEPQSDGLNLVTRAQPAISPQLCPSFTLLGLLHDRDHEGSPC